MRWGGVLDWPGSFMAPEFGTIPVGQRWRRRDFVSPCRRFQFRQKPIPENPQIIQHIH